MKGVYLADAFSNSSSICNGGSMVHKYSEDSLRFLIAFFFSQRALQSKCDISSGSK